MIDQRLEKLAEVLVNYSTRVKRGDRVYIGAEDAAIPFIQAVARAAIKKGAFVEYDIEVPEVLEAKIKYGNEDQLKKPNAAFSRAVREGDVWITAWGSKNLKAESNYDINKVTMNRLANSESRKIYVSRSASGELRWCGTQFPTQADAQEAEMSLSEYEDFVYNAGYILCDDPVKEWERIDKEQQRWVDYLDTKEQLRIISEGTDISVNIKGRKWINCCGHENFPDGEIFTSPVENDINGHITFSYPAIYGGHEVENVYLEVVDGKIVKATANKNEEYLNATLDTDPGARFFGEVAIGTNYGIKKHTKNMLFDEKIGGTVHMAAGSAMPEAGGINESVIHWDMLCDMRNGGEIYADGELFYKDGQFINSVLSMAHTESTM